MQSLCFDSDLLYRHRAIVAEGYTPPAVPAIVSVVAQSNQPGPGTRFQLQSRSKCQSLQKTHNFR